MSMNPVPRKVDNESQRLIDEYLEKGGTITKCNKSDRSTDIEYKSYYGKKKKKEANE